MKLPQWTAPFVFSAVMATGMAFIMSAIITYINLGFTARFLFDWLKSFSLVVWIAYPVSLIMSVIAKKVVNKLYSESH